MSKKKVRCYYCQKKEALSFEFQEVKEGNNNKYFHKECLIKHNDENKK